MTGQRRIIVPADTRMLEWASREEFGRVRAEWLQLHRWDTELSPASIVLLAEIGGRMAHDRDWAWPSISRLAADVGWSEPTVKRGVAGSIERGWLAIERRGFGGSNRYCMAWSPSVMVSVSEQHERRIAGFVETRPAALRSKMIRMATSTIEINSDPSLGSKMISHTDQNRSLIEINPDPLTLSQNLTKEADHRSSTDPLGDRVQDEAHGVPSFSEFDLYAVLGAGDLKLGERRAKLLGHQRCGYLLKKIEELGVLEAVADIKAAISLANDLEPTHSFARAEP